MKRLKEQKAITLVALVITIIVLLILAGVALSLVVGENGITARAVKSRKTHNIAGAVEKVELEIANLASEFYQAKYINNSLSGASTVGDYVFDKLQNGDGYTVTKVTTDENVKKVTVTASDGTSRTGTIGSDGKVAWEGVEYGTGAGGSGGSGTGGGETPATPVTTTYTITYDANGGSGTMTATTGEDPAVVDNEFTAPTAGQTFVKWNTSADGSGTDYAVGAKPGASITLYAQWTAPANNATVTVPSNAQVGAYIPYDITYTDVYTNYGFTASDGWRLLSIEDETGKTTKTIKLISTGIPAKLYYKYDSTSNNGWWGTTGNTNVKAAYGLENNFESISFAAGNTATDNSGCFTNINGTNSEDVTGAIFKIPGDNVSVHNLTLGELNAARNLAASSTTSTATTDGATGLFYLRNLATNYSYTTSTKCYYWLASPYASYASTLYYVISGGDIGSGYHSGATYGVRPVVSISGVTLSK